MIHWPRSLRGRLFVGIAATVAVSAVVMLAVGAALTRRSLDEDAKRALIEAIVEPPVFDPMIRRTCRPL